MLLAVDAAELRVDIDSLGSGLGLLLVIRSASRQDARETGSVPQLGMPAKPGGDSARLDPDAASDVGQG